MPPFAHSRAITLLPATKAAKAAPGDLRIARPNNSFYFERRKPRPVALLLAGEIADHLAVERDLSPAKRALLFAIDGCMFCFVTTMPPVAGKAWFRASAPGLPARRAASIVSKELRGERWLMSPFIKSDFTTQSTTCL